MQHLQTTYTFKIRFSEIDAMRVVWHGAYAKYFEDAREAFGLQYGISYKQIADNGYYVPVVELSFKYKKPLRYGMTPKMTITYYPTDAAKMVFDYEIIDGTTGETMVTGHSVQVFINYDYQLELINPPFFEKWKNAHLAE